MKINTRTVSGKYINFELEAAETSVDLGLHDGAESIAKLEYLESVCSNLRHDIERMFGISEDVDPWETKFKNVGCSQCGEDFGPGDHGFSHCENHQTLISDDILDDIKTAVIATTETK